MLKLTFPSQASKTEFFCNNKTFNLNLETYSKLRGKCSAFTDINLIVSNYTNEKNILREPWLAGTYM